MDYNLLARLEKKGNSSISVKPIFKKNDDSSNCLLKPFEVETFSGLSRQQIVIVA